MQQDGRLPARRSNLIQDIWRNIRLDTGYPAGYRISGWIPDIRQNRLAGYPANSVSGATLIINAAPITTIPVQINLVCSTLPEASWRPCWPGWAACPRRSWTGRSQCWRSCPPFSSSCLVRWGCFYLSYFFFHRRFGVHIKHLTSLITGYLSHNFEVDIYSSGD